LDEYLDQKERERERLIEGLRALHHKKLDKIFV